MNYGVLLLIALLVLAAIEVLVGIRRGAALMGVRVALWAVLTVVAGLIAKPVSRAILNLIIKRMTIFGNLLAGAFAKEGMSDAINSVLPGYALSALTPFVFAGLFIVMKFVSWLIYLIIRKVLLNKCENVFTCNSTLKKVIGGAAGLIVGIWACAIVASPVSGLVKTFDDSGAVDAAFDAAGKVLSLQGVPVGDILTGKVQGATASDKVILGRMTVSDIRDSYISVSKSPASMVCRYTGGEGIAMAIYRSMSEVESGGEVFNLPESLAQVLSIVGDADGTVTLLAGGSGLSSELIASVEGLIFKVLDSELAGQLVSEEARVTLINSFLPKIESSLTSALNIGQNSSDTILKPFDSYETFYRDLAVVFDIAGIPAGMLKDGGSVTLQSLMNDRDSFGELLGLLAKLNSGPEIIASLINSAYPDYGAITSAEMVASVDADTLVSLCDDMMLLSDTEPGDINSDNYKDYMAVVDRVNESGILIKKIEP